MAFMDLYKLDKTYKILVFRLASMILSPLFLFQIRNDDTLKFKKENQKLNNGLEKFIYLFGWFLIVAFVLLCLYGIYTNHLQPYKP